MQPRRAATRQNKVRRGINNNNCERRNINAGRVNETHPNFGAANHKCFSNFTFTYRLHDSTNEWAAAVNAGQGLSNKRAWSRCKRQLDPFYRRIL